VGDGVEDGVVVGVGEGSGYLINIFLVALFAPLFAVIV